MDNQLVINSPEQHMCPPHMGLGLGPFRFELSAMDYSGQWASPNFIIIQGLGQINGITAQYRQITKS